MIDRVIEFVRGQGRPAWLVGGYVRDRLLDRPTNDLDLIVPSAAVRLARRLGEVFGGASFVLDAQRDVGRAILPGPTGQTLEVDVARLRVPDLLDDLALRDFTVNAMALDLSGAGLPLIDPFGGRTDVDRRLLRAVTEGAFCDDPLRMLRGVRMIAELDFSLDGATFNLIRRDAHLLGAASPERVRDELVRILDAPRAWQHLRLMQDLQLLQAAIPETAVQAGVTQSPPHYQDVFDHTRSVLAHLEGIFALIQPGGPYALPAAVPGDPTVMAPPEQWRDLEALLAPYRTDLLLHLALPLAAGRTRREALAWAALAHDWGKPAKRTVEEGGRVRFFEHDHWGALVARARLQALKFAGDEIDYVAGLTDLHMRPGELARMEPVTPRAEYRFFRDAGSTGPDVVLLSLADHLASFAPAPDAERWRRRLDMARRVLHAYFRDRTERVSPLPLLDGRQVMAELSLSPGPAVGALLEGLREAQAVGQVRTTDEALAWLREQPAPDQGR